MTNFVDWPQMDREKLLHYLRGSSFRSERYRILYVATPKVACTSLKWWFAALEGKTQILRDATDSSESDPDLIIHDNFHKFAPEVLGLSPDIIEDMLSSDSYFRFSVVRNPYKRIFSAWQSKLLLQEPLQIGPYTKFEFFHYPLTSSADIATAFEGFLEHLARNEAPTYWDPHWTPQAQLLRPDLINYSRIFKIENRDELGDAIVEWVGEYIPSPFAGRRTNESLIPYLSEFMTARSAELIRTLYAEDFNIFGYDKEPPVTEEVFSQGQFDLAFKAIKVIRARHQRLGMRNVQSAHLNHAIVTRDANISSLEELISEHAVQLVSLNQALVEYGGQTTRLQQLIDERDLQIAESNKVVDELDAQIESLNRSLIELDDTIDSRNQIVGQRDKQLSSLNKVVVELKGHIADQAQMTAGQTSNIAGYEHQIAEYQRKLVHLDRLVSEQKAHIGHLDQIIGERNSSIVHLEHSIQERDSSLARRDTELATLIGYTGRLELDTKQQVEDMQQELGRIMRSRSWRVTAHLRKIRNSFKPKGRNSGAPFLGRVASLLGVRHSFALRSSIRQIQASALFDSDYYIASNPDVEAANIAPEVHYFLYGWKELRNPSVEFNTEKYLFDNPDVRRYGINPLYHYLKWGKKEGRQIPTLTTLEANVINSESEPTLSDWVVADGNSGDDSVGSGVFTSSVSEEPDSVKAEDADVPECPTIPESGSFVDNNDCSEGIEDSSAGFTEAIVVVDTAAQDLAAKAIIDAEVEAISKSGRFDESFYLSMYTELEIERSQAIRHYCESGWKEGLNPCDDFDTKSYLSTYSDIRNANLNPFWHYVVAGASELRHAIPDAAIRYENSVRFGATGADLKLLAFFTSPDWTSLRNGRSASRGSSQPLLPHDTLGFYDSQDSKVLEQQSALAKQHGFYGFCFELDDECSDTVSPVDILLESPEIDFNFCIQIQLQMTDSTESTLASLKRAFLDDRYIKVDSRPVIVATLSCAKNFASRILRKFRADIAAEGIVDIFLIVRASFKGWDTSMTSLVELCDVIMELPANPVPHETGNFAPLKKNGVEIVPYAVVASQGVARCQKESNLACPQYQVVTLGRDNTAQQTEHPLMYSRFHVRDYRRWLDAAISNAKRLLPEDRRFVFVNAWNDWNGGLFLEPDRQGGFGRLNETTRALLGVASGALMPKVSVLVPNYNHERFLAQRLDSIYGQTYKNIEVILMDDCSTDQSREVLNEYALANHETTRTLFNEVNSGGPFRQWAKGIAAATGDLIWIAESDDYCDERFLEKLVSTFEDEAVLLAYANTVFVTEDGVPMQDEHKMYVSDLTCADKWNESYVETAHNEVRVALGIKNTIPNASGVVFKRPIDMALLNDETWLSMKAAGDWVFYLHQIRGGKIAYSREATNFFRRYKGSAAESTYKKEAFYRELGMSGRTVQELYNVPPALLEQSQISCKAMYDYHAAGSDEQFADWYGVEAIKQARANRKPNILVSTMGFYPGGAEILPIRMANEFKRQGLSVLLLSAGLNPREDGVRRMLRNDVPLVETSDVEAMKNIISEFGVDALNTHQWHIQKYPLYVPEVFDKLGSHVASLHGMIEHGNAFGVTEYQLRLADKGVTTWVYTAEKNLGPFSNFSIYDPSSPRFVKLPNGMKPSAIIPIPRSHMGIPDSAFVLCCVSRAILDKGWAEAILAVERARKLSGRDIRLILVGNGPVYEEYCREGTPDFVYLAGFSENSVGHYASADMGIMLTTFKSESFPLTIVDCLFAGKPYIASDVGDIKNMLSTNEEIAGEVIRLDDWEVPIEAAGEVIAAFATDKTRYDDVLSLVPEVASRYKIDVVARQYVDLFQRDMALAVAETSDD